MKFISLIHKNGLSVTESDELPLLISDDGVGVEAMQQEDKNGTESR